jgi:hypothetical protein
MELKFITFSKNNIIYIVLYALLGFVIYSNSINGSFLLDDNFLIVENTHIKNPSRFYLVFKEDIGAGADYLYNYYRPIFTTTFIADYALYKLNPAGFHITNILLHILTGLSLCWLIHLLFNNKILSYIAGILFLIHPIQTEAVAYISGRADILAGLFTILCFCFYILFNKEKKPEDYFSMLFCFICALLSKESSIVIPALFLLYHYIFKIKASLQTFMPILAATAIYIFLHQIIINTSSHISSQSIYTGTLYFFKSLPIYLKIITAPFGLHYDYGKPALIFKNSEIVLGLAVFIILILVFFFKRKTNKLLSFSIIWFLLTLIPSLNFYPTSYYMAEHYLYLPIAGFTLVISNYLYNAYIKNKQITIICICIIFIFYSALTVQQNKYWKNPASLYERILKYNSKSMLAYNNMANFYARNKNYNEAFNYYKKALAITPRPANIYYNMGETYKIIGEIEKAIVAYKKAIAIDPYYIEAYYNLAALEKNKKKAFVYYKKGTAAKKLQSLMSKTKN